MNRAFKCCAAGLALSLVASQALAAGCARPQDLQAVRAAAVQQKLMVAALSCDATGLYNRFVTAYRKELQRSDRTLRQFFRRLNARTGTADYHAFKTRLANTSSISSVGDMRGFCNHAKSLFDTALNVGKKTLAALVGTEPEDVSAAFTPCTYRLAGHIAPPPPDEVPVPRQKPLSLVVPAQGMSLRPGE